MMQVNDEYAVVKDMPVATPREAGGAKPGDNGLQSLRVPASEQPTTTSAGNDLLASHDIPKHPCSLWGFLVSPLKITHHAMACSPRGKM